MKGREKKMKNEREAKPATNAMYYEEQEYKLEDELDCDKGYVHCCREGGDDYIDDDDKGENDSDVNGSHGNDGDEKLVHKGFPKYGFFTHDEISRINSIRDSLSKIFGTNISFKQKALYAREFFVRGFDSVEKIENNLELVLESHVLDCMQPCDKEEFLKQMKNKLCKDDDKDDDEDHNQEKSKIDVIDLCSSDDDFE